MLYLLVGPVVVLLGYFIASPFLNTSPAGADVGTADTTIEEDVLLVQRDRLLRSLKDLEFDRSTGKFDDAEYLKLRADLAAQTSHVLDDIERRSAPAASVAPLDTELELEVLIARARKRTRGRWSCATCNRTMNATDKFCASCGSARPDRAVTASATPNPVAGEPVSL
jgi:hypothetical protein